MASREQLPPGAQEQLQKLENLQSQAQQIAQQKAQVKNRLSSVEQSLDKLDEVGEGRNIYEIVGDLLIEAEGKNEVVTDLQEKKEELDMRLKSLERKEKQITENFEELQQQLQQQLQAGGMDFGAAQ